MAVNLSPFLAIFQFIVSLFNNPLYVVPCVLQDAKGDHKGDCTCDIHGNDSEWMFVGDAKCGYSVYTGGHSYDNKLDSNKLFSRSYLPSLMSLKF